MFYLFLFAHLVADFVLQPFWLVQRKRTWGGLFLHGGIVLACMLALPLFDRATLSLWPAMLAITGIHIIADRLKVQLRDEGKRHDLVDAVFALGDDDLVRITRRVEALDALFVWQDTEG